MLSLLVGLVLSTSILGGDARAMDDEERAAKQNAVERHLLRVQQERFEAEARGEDARRMKRLNREFRRTQLRRRDLMRDAQNAAPTN
jgi:hypothetical protein